MIGIAYADGYLCPVVMCDVCEKVIRSHHDGVTVSVIPESNVHPDRVFYAHRGACHTAVEKKIKAETGKHTGWMALDEHVVLLTHALVIDPGKARANIEKLNDLMG